MHRFVICIMFALVDGRGGCDSPTDTEEKDSWYCIFHKWDSKYHYVLVFMIIFMILVGECLCPGWEEDTNFESDRPSEMSEIVIENGQISE
jgi:hypothetical protein